jgi:hypothetical protein
MVRLDPTNQTLPRCSDWFTASRAVMERSLDAAGFYNMVSFGCLRVNVAKPPQQSRQF